MIVINLHVSYGTAGIIARSLKCQGHTVKAVHLYRGEDLPEIKDCQGVISLGGPMSANDSHIYDWLRLEKRFLAQAIEKNIPVVGICLGAQILASVLGAKIQAAPQPEVGWFPVSLNNDGKADPILSSAGVSPTVYHWHLENFSLPSKAIGLASSQYCEHQAFRLGENIYGFQFHPEIDHHLVKDRFSRLGNTRRIEELSTQFGKEAQIQTPDQHVALAVEHESSSLRIAAALTSVFPRKKFQEVPESFRQTIRSVRENFMDVQIRLRPNPARRLNLQGRIVREFSSHGSEFAILQETHGILWAIRLDDICELVPVEGRLRA
jgi:GMP synthase-like glutamine amidotransferase